MEIEKIFNDLESNQVQEWEDAKQKLVDLFLQNKEQWVAQYMMEYFLRTGSLRIMEVLIRAQSPHDSYIFDRLDDWLKTHQFRVQALNLFSFIVRKHPTWLFKVEKHRLIKTIIKLLLTEKEIVPLMSALLCIITLLPIIPSLVPNFLGDLFEVFGHLAAWNAQNQNRLPEDKLVHLQLGLQMLFHRLYGMFPCNFLSYLSDFIRKERGAIFQHTIQPLLETVRVHPMLVTATTESEMSNVRWKEKEPHDVVMDCVRVSLPVVYQDFNIEITQSVTSARSTPGISYTRSNSYNTTSSGNFRYEIRDVYQQLGPISRFDGGGTELVRASALWSPFNEISAHTPMPLTPTPSYRLTLTATPNIHNHHLAQAGSSPPEAAVEATPETTPLKVSKDLKQNENPLAVRTLFAPASEGAHRPLLKTLGSALGTQLNFEEVSSEPTDSISLVEQETRYTRRIQQVIQERTQSQSPFQTIEALNAKRSNRASLTPGSELTNAESPYGPQHTFTPTSTTMSSPMATPAPPTPMENISKICDDCNETTDSLCTAGGLHTPTSRSIEIMAKGIKRRSRFISYCCNEVNHRLQNETQLHAGVKNGNKIRRTKSCDCIFLTEPVEDRTLTPTAFVSERRLQKSSKMLSIAKATKKAIASRVGINVSTQTVETEPQNYEHLLFTILQQTDEKRSEIERQRFLRNPQEIFNRYVNSCWLRDSFDNVPGTGYRIDQEQYQLLCLQLQYERYRREIHAERNRRLMGRSRDRRNLEMERDRLREQFKNIAVKDKDLISQIDQVILEANEKEQEYLNQLNSLKMKYEHEVDQNKCLRQANENLEQRLTDEITKSRELNGEVEVLRSEVFNMASELANAQQQAEIGMICKQELARLEAEFITMGEVQIKCRDRLVELEHYQARGEELLMLQNTYNAELKELKSALDERTCQLDGAKHKLVELQTQLTNSDKVITDQKRLLKAVKDEYEEKFKALNRKYDVQKIIITNMENNLVMSLNKPPSFATQPCSPGTDRTDMGSSADRNSSLSTSLASSESLSASLRSTATELRNLQHLVEPNLAEAVNIFENTPMNAIDLTNSSNSAVINIGASSSSSVIKVANIASGEDSKLLQKQQKH